MDKNEEAKVRAELASAVKEQLPKTLENLFTAALIWLFGVSVFLPAATRKAPLEAPLIIALIVLVAFSIFLFKAFGGLRLLLDAISDLTAYKYLRCKKETETPIERLRVITRCIVYIVAVLFLFTLYFPLLSAIHPSLAGLAFIPIVLWIFLKILKIMNPPSKPRGR